MIDGLCEHPARSKEGPDICLRQIVGGLDIAAARAGISANDVVLAGLDTPGPASSAGVLSARGSTNFVHADWAGFDIRDGLSRRLRKPVTYLNDGNAGALWGHFTLFGAGKPATSISAIIGTGLGGGVIVDGDVVKGRKGFGGELGHVLIPYQSIEFTSGIVPHCNCGRIGDLESMCSLTAIGRTLLPYFLLKYPGHELASIDTAQAAKRVRGLAERGDPMCRDIFRAQAHALIVGGGDIETGLAFQAWFVDEIRAGMPAQREEQADIPIHIMPNGDTAGSRGAAIEALALARKAGLV